MKLKLPPVLVLFMGLALIFGAHQFIPEWSFLFPFQKTSSRVFLALGVLVAFSGIITFRMHGTTSDPRFPEKASALVRTGVFKFTRNPMYLGMAFVLFGGIIRIGNPLGLSGVILFVWYINEFQVKPEEEALKKLFGEEYRTYCERVRRWI